MNEMEDFRRKNTANCDKAKQKLEQNLGFKFRIYINNKYIIVELIKDDTDYKSLSIEYRNIERDMESGKSFEDSVFDEFVFVLAHENNRLNHYEANIWEKLLSTYIKNVEVFPDGNWYCINNEHGLCKYTDTNLFVNEEIVNTEDIISLNFKPNEIEIGIKDSCDDEDQVCGYLVNNEGWKKIQKDGSMSNFKIIEPNLTEKYIPKLRELKSEIKDVPKNVDLSCIFKNADATRNLVPNVNIKPFNVPNIPNTDNKMDVLISKVDKLIDNK